MAKVNEVVAPVEVSADSIKRLVQQINAQMKLLQRQIDEIRARNS